MNLGRSWIWYLAGLALAVIAGVAAILALRQAVPAAPAQRVTTRPVIVAKRDLTGRQVLAPDALETKEIALENIPSGAIYRIEDATGKLLLQDAKAGQPLLAQNLTIAATGAGSVITTSAALTALLPPDKVAVVLPVTDLLGQSGELNIGDRIDLLASMMVAGQEGAGGQVTLMNMQNVLIIKLLQQAAPSSGNQQQRVVRAAMQKSAPSTPRRPSGRT